MDWGLLDSNAGENRFLREEVVYSTAVSRVTLFIAKRGITCYTCFLVVLLFRNNRRFYTTIYMDCEFYSH